MILTITIRKSVKSEPEAEDVIGEVKDKLEDIQPFEISAVTATHFEIGES